MYYLRSILLIPCFLLFYPTASTAQTVVTIPDYPTDADSVTVIFDATKGNAELMNGSPPIYAHTGVITDQSSSTSDWKYVVASWNLNLPKALMTPVGNNIFHLKLTPGIRAFYGVPPGETILKLAFVFRNSDGSLCGRESDGGDIFSEVYPPFLSVTFISPAARSLFLHLNDPIPVNAASPMADSLKLFVNNTLVQSVAGKSIKATLQANNFGHNWVKNWVKIVAKNDTASIADSFSYTVIAQPSIAPLPPGTVDGINYIDSSTVILSLYAPGKNNCFVIGDFEAWLTDSAHYMLQTPDHNRFWLQINNLVPGKEYLFQYLVNGTIRIADPYCDKVCDPDDQYISPETYPGLLAYPLDKTSEIASYLQTAQAPYTWQPSSFIPPKVTDLVIYELLIRDFIGKHDYPHLEDTLDYLKRLGINAIELMPVMEFEGNNSWGYNPDFMFAPDKYYGTRNGLKHFIETAHSKGFAVILDIVLNHQFGKSPLVRLYWDGANNRPAADNPWFNPVPKHPYNVGNDFNHDSQQTKSYCDRVLKYWITEYHIDGYRFDLSKGFTQKNSYPDNVGLWGQYDADRVYILKHYYSGMRTVKPDIIMILEHFADNDEETELSSSGMLLWGNENSPYNEATMGWNSSGKSDFSGVSYQQRGWADPHLVGYMESHDEERLMFKNIAYGNSAPWYNIKDTNTALHRVEMAAAFFYTVPGPKMLWEFGELGYDYSINYPCGNSNCRLNPKPPRWDYDNQWRRHNLFNFVRSLITLKKEQEVFSTSNYSMDVSGPLKTISLTGSSMDVFLVGNFDVNPGSADLQFQKTGRWYDYFSGDSVEVTGLPFHYTLLPGEYHLYTTVRLQKPLFTGIGEFNPPLSGNLHKVIVYPTPSSDFLNVVSATKMIQATVWSMQGKNLLTINDPVKIDISGLEKGLYLLTVIFEDHSSDTLKFTRN